MYIFTVKPNNFKSTQFLHNKDKTQLIHKMPKLAKASVSTPELPKLHKKVEPQYLDKKFEELYNESVKLKERKLKIQQQRVMQQVLEQQKHCTFKPSIIHNPETISTVHDPSSFLERGQHWKQRKDKKVSELAQVYQKRATKECSFRPQVSKNSYNLLHNPKESRLFRNSSYANNAQFKKTYREIHMKKGALRELQKTNSAYEFTLLTDRNRKSPLKQNIGDAEYIQGTKQQKVPSIELSVSKTSMEKQEKIEGDGCQLIVRSEMKTQAGSFVQSSQKTEDILVTDKQSQEEEGLEQKTPQNIHNSLEAENQEIADQFKAQESEDLFSNEHGGVGPFKDGAQQKAEQGDPEAQQLDPLSEEDHPIQEITEQDRGQDEDQECL